MATAGEGGRADWFLVKLGPAALLSGNVMVFQSLLYFGSLYQMGSDVLQSSSWIMLVCSILIYVARWSGCSLRSGSISTPNRAACRC